MCFRPADAQSANKTCAACGASVGMFDAKCPECGKEIESAPGMPGVPIAPGAPGAPGIPGTPKAPGAPGAPKAPGM